MPDANTNRSRRDLAAEPAQPPQDRTTELESDNRRIKDTIQSLQHKNTLIGRELQEYKNLSEIRGKELLASQVFLRKADQGGSGIRMPDRTPVGWLPLEA